MTNLTLAKLEFIADNFKLDETVEKFSKSVENKRRKCSLQALSPIPSVAYGRHL